MSQRRAKFGEETIDPADKILIDECLCADSVMSRRARERLVAAYKDGVYQRLWGILGRTPLADDAFQETFCRVLRALATYRSQGPLKRWIDRIAINSALTLLVKEKKKPDRPNRLNPAAAVGHNDLYAPAAAAVANPERQVAAVEILRAMQDLDRHRRAVLLFAGLGYSDRDIALLTGMNENTVGTQKYRGRQDLARLLAVRSRSGGPTTGRSC